METTRRDLKALNRKDTGLTQELPIKIVQFGEGNFLRGFVDYIVDKLNTEANFNAGVAMIQPLPGGRVQKLNDQDGLYHLFMKGIKKGKEVEDCRLISCMQKGIDPYKDYQSFLGLAKEEELQFVISNTTEAGIAFDARDKKDTFPHYSFPAKVTALFYERFQYFKADPDAGLTVIPCELINNNADKLKEIILKYAQLWDLEPEFIDWVETYNSFHNTLVDRIVPGYPKEEIEKYQSQLEYADNSIVSAEEFLLWVIEGDERLKKKIPFDQIDENILIVNDLQPYRTRKVRILNGAHTVMVPFSLLYGNKTVKETIDNRFTGSFVQEAIYKEVIPSLDLPEEELKEFAEQVFDRFRNPFIRHQLSSIALNSVSKFKVRVLPSLLAFQKKYNRLPCRLTFALACLIRFYKGEWKGRSLPVKDDAEIIKKFHEIWELGDYSKISSASLQETQFWGKDLTRLPGLQENIEKALREIDENGIETGWNKFLEEYL